MDEDKLLWETEFWALNFQTGDIDRHIHKEYVVASNLEEAQKNLLLTGKGFLRLTGNWFTDEHTIKQYKEFHKKLKDLSVFKSMTYDQIMDWLETGDESDLRIAISVFEKNGMSSYVKMVKAQLKLRYGSEEEES